MSEAVLDASAILAFAKGEPGSDIVKQYLPNALLSTVNYAEVQQKVGTSQESSHLINALLNNFRVKLVDFTADHARCVALLYPLAKKGISLADRACIATASLLGLPVITGDARWADLGLQLEVVLFRTRQLSS